MVVDTAGNWVAIVVLAAVVSGVVFMAVVSRRQPNQDGKPEQPQEKGK